MKKIVIFIFLLSVFSNNFAMNKELIDVLGDPNKKYHVKNDQNLPDNPFQKFLAIRCADLKNQAQKEFLRAVFKYSFIYPQFLYDKYEKKEFNLAINVVKNSQIQVLEMIKEFYKPSCEQQVMDSVHNLINIRYQAEFTDNKPIKYPTRIKVSYAPKYMVAARLYGIIKNFDAVIELCKKESTEEEAVAAIHNTYFYKMTGDALKHNQEYWDIQEMFQPNDDSE
jgi:hypothetical protein